MAAKWPLALYAGKPKELQSGDVLAGLHSSAQFAPVTVLAATSGAITIDWSANQNYKQPEPTGAITYTFTDPAGPCKLQLFIDSDGTSPPQTFTWPAAGKPVVWLGSAWSAVANKKAIINMFYDGSNYYLMGSNQA